MLPETLPFSSIKTIGIRLKCDVIDVVQLAIRRSIPAHVYPNLKYLVKVPKETVQVEREYVSKGSTETAQVAITVTGAKFHITDAPIASNGFEKVRQDDLYKFLQNDPIRIHCFDSGSNEYDLAPIYYGTPFNGYGVIICLDGLFFKDEDIHALTKPAKRNKQTHKERQQSVMKYASDIFDGKMTSEDIAKMYISANSLKLDPRTIMKDINMARLKKQHRSIK